MARESARDKLNAYYEGLPDHIREGQGRRGYSSFGLAMSTLSGISPVGMISNGVGTFKRAISRVKENASNLESLQSEYDNAKSAYEHIRLRRGRKAKQLAEAQERFENAGQALSDAKTNIASSKAMGVASLAGKAVSTFVTQTMSGFSFSVSGIAKATGNSSLQERAMREQEIVNEHINAAMAIGGGAAAGALAGAAFGLVGAGVGAVVGASIAFIAIEADRQRKYEERRRDYEYESWKFDTARSVSMQRAGVVLASGRLHQF